LDEKRGLKMKKTAILTMVCFLMVGSHLAQPAQARVKVGADIDRPVVTAGSEERIVVKVGLWGEELAPLTKRLPINLSIVLDKSGSMASHDKMENAKKGAIEIVERLTKEDILSVIVYDSQPRVLISAQPVRDKHKIIKLISSVCAGGNTALYGGVSFGASEVRKYSGKDYIPRVILLSDGLANVGPQSTGELADLGRSLSKEDITVTTVGVGLDYNEDLMAALANESGGNSYFASTSSELPKIFAEEIGETMTLMARNVKIRLDCPEEIAPVRIIGRKGEVSGNSMEVVINNLYGKNEKYALFEILLPKRKDGVTIQAASINVEYRDPHTKKVLSEQREVTIQYSRDNDLIEGKKNKDIIKEVALTRTSEIKREAIKFSDQGDYGKAAQLIEERGVELEKIAQTCDNDKELLKEAQDCRDNSKTLTVNKGMNKYQRKRITNDSNTQVWQQYYISR